jgi:hypothetical protein
LLPSSHRSLRRYPLHSIALTPPEPPPAVGATADRRRPPLRPNSGTLQPVGELLVVHGRLPGRQRHRLAGAGRARAPPQLGTQLC